jgi:type II secretory pathway pseudopilin PulG
MRMSDKTLDRRPHQGRGFTLVEILATFVLVAIILPVAMKGISLATTMASLSKERIEAATLAETKLAELLATGEWQNGNLSGDFSPDWPKYRWSAEVQDWQETTLRQLDVRVEWESRGMKRDVQLTTLVYVESP